MYMGGLSFEDELGLECPGKKYTQILDLKQLPSDRFKNSSHAAHCMIYALNSKPVMKAYLPKASILMQLRFDGHFGFPGGVVEKGETPEEAVAREMEEEMGILRHNFRIFPEDHVVTHYSEEKDLLLHFFTKEVSLNRLLNIEATAVKGDYYGEEVMGIVRIPLYTMADGFRGFPAFLSHGFIGNSKEQLLHALVAKELFTSEEIQTALAAKPKIMSKINKITT
ncbi:U8 snoRNA-decapping enzyme [Halyomorpha halys]|uniref:U8 snoRNA-decapping enzyme n=1 Tax=Halyomorpha halys TaxID=286706 RepID=UPI0006D4ECC0|nr:uncharacterized protein LOC106683938 [Halyomorpha halys]